MCARRSVLLFRRSPSRLTPREVRVIQDMVTSPEYRHVPTGTLAVLAQRLDTVWASPSTWTGHGRASLNAPTDIE
jgi:hypothetical protein